jgi:predicted permease
MRILSWLRALWWNLARRRDVAAALDEELAAYVDLVAAEHQRAGLATDAARRAALLEVGGIESTKEAARDAWTGNSILVALRETRQTIRSLRRTPVYVVTIVLTLAVAIGSATALFTIVKGSLLRPLPAVAQPDRLISIEPMHGSTPLYDFSYPDFEDLRKASSLASLAMYDGTPMALRDSIGSGRAWVSYVTGDFFSVLGVRPAAGRLLDTTDVGANIVSPAVVIAYDLWQKRFGGSRATIGSKVMLDGYPLTIVGVAPKGFLGAMAFHRMEMWIPVTMLGPVSHSPTRVDLRGETAGRLVGRLAAGRSVDVARAELTQIGERLAKTYAEDRNRSVAVYAGAGMTIEEREDASRLPRLLAIAIVLVLLVACANVASLSLTRTAARRRELATRLALGASRSSLIARLLIESGMLAGTSAVAGVGLAMLLVRSAPLVNMVVDMDAMDLSLDWRVLTVTIGVSIAAMLLVAFASGIETLRVSPASLLRDGGGAVRRRSRGQRALVVVQVAVSLVLLASSASVFRAVRRTMAKDSGLDARGVTMAFLNPHDAGLDLTRQSAFYHDVLAGVAADRSVEAAALATTVPPARWAQPSRVFRRGEEPPPGVSLDRGEHVPTRAYVDVVSPGFFGVLRIPLLLGRDIAPTDDQSTERVAVVSKSLADALWPNENPIAKYVVRVRSSGARTAVRVVGVAGDVRFAGMAADAGPALYMAQAQNDNLGNLTLVMRGRGGRSVPDSLARIVTRRLAPEMDPGASTSLEAQIHDEFSPQRRMTGWLAAFGAVTLLLAAIGLYGVIAQDVLQRMRELAVRSALGATPSALVGMIVREGAALTALGVGVGGAASIAAIRVVRSMFSGLAAVDVGVCILAVGPLVVAAFIASYLPARRIARLDAARALRAD